jgi:hypothetical protein
MAAELPLRPDENLPSSKSERKAFALRLPAATLAHIEKWANEEFRSTNGQIEYLLNEALKKRSAITPPPRESKPSQEATDTSTAPPKA